MPLSSSSLFQTWRLQGQTTSAQHLFFSIKPPFSLSHFNPISTNFNPISDSPSNLYYDPNFGIRCRRDLPQDRHVRRRSGSCLFDPLPIIQSLLQRHEIEISQL